MRTRTISKSAIQEVHIQTPVLILVFLVRSAKIMKHSPFRWTENDDGLALIPSANMTKGEDMVLLQAMMNKKLNQEQFKINLPAWIKEKYHIRSGKKCAWSIVHGELFGQIVLKAQ